MGNEHLILRQLPLVALWTNAQGIIQGCSNKFASIFDQDVESVIGREIYEFFTADGINQLKMLLKECLKNGKLIQINKDIYLSVPEKKAGCFTWQVQPYLSNSNEILGFIFNGTQEQDVQSDTYVSSLAKKLTGVDKPHLSSGEHMQMMLDYFQAIIDLMPGHLYWMDRNQVYLGCNKELIRNFQVKSANDVVGKTNFDFFDKITAIQLNKTNQQVMNTGVPFISEEYAGVDTGDPNRLFKPSGWFLSQKFPLYDREGKVIGMLGHSVEINKIKQAEQQLIMNMSHDIKTPFTGVLGFAKLLERNETDADKKEKLGYIVTSTEKLLSFINQVIELAKLDGPPAVKYELIQLNELVENAVELTSATAHQKGIKLITNLNRNLPQYIQHDKWRLDTILLNLLGNAIKFTKQGSITISIQPLYSVNKNSSHIEITVKDTGIGIPENKFNEIFHRFTRVTPSYQQNIEGTGIGLWLVKRFVDDLNGKIKVKSKLGKGTSFIITIDANAPSQEQLQQLSANSQSCLENIPPITAHTLPPKILYVEDNLIAVKLMQAELAELKYIADHAATGQHAIQLANKNAYDLIFMDIGLPDIDGFEVADAIRVDSKSKNASIIGLTAHIDQNHNPGKMNCIIMKPLDKNVLIKILNLIQSGQVKEGLAAD
jgi:two-component system aerobic respiration control sensor histidine kinase ArcB